MPLACLPAAIQFRHLILGGDAKVQRYCHELAVAGGVYLARAWGTRLLVKWCFSTYSCFVLFFLFFNII